jgi:hypothetical protein
VVVFLYVRKENCLIIIIHPYPVIAYPRPFYPLPLILRRFHAPVSRMPTPMPRRWNEIKTRAVAFVLEWKDSWSVREKAEAQTFETEFLKVFGVDWKKAALFEQEVHFEDGQGSLFDDPAGRGRRGYIDLF